MSLLNSLRTFFVALSLPLIFCATVQAQTDAVFAQIIDSLNAQSALKVSHVKGNIYLLLDPESGTNISLQIADEGVALVDTGLSENAEQSLAMIRELSDGPIRFLINTTGIADYTGGNALISAAGDGYASEDPRADGVAHEKTMLSMALSADQTVPAIGWPNLAFIEHKQMLYFNDEPIEIIHYPNANSNSENIVFFRQSDVISTGPVYLTTTYPLIYPEQGGSIDGVITALNGIIDITVTRKNQEGGTLVIPGEGRISDEGTVVEYRDMLTIIRNRIDHYMSQGLELDEIQALQPTMDYDVRFAASRGPAAPENFIEIIYNNLLARNEEM